MRAVGLTLAVAIAAAAAIGAETGGLDDSLLAVASLYLALKLVAIFTPSAQWTRGWVRWLVVCGNAVATSVAILAIIKAA